ncbi:MAG TPA: hypothetical protein VMU13_00985 [Candidatus Paceibacterota bacterium]|nr:hypothetical protein [Candidatus Paceibacterota bacterium]
MLEEAVVKISPMGGSEKFRVLKDQHGNPSYIGLAWYRLSKQEKGEVIRSFLQLFPDITAETMANAVGRISRSSIIGSAHRNGIKITDKGYSGRCSDAERDMLKDTQRHRSASVASGQKRTSAREFVRPVSGGGKKAGIDQFSDDPALRYWQDRELSLNIKCETEGHGGRPAVFKKGYCPECCKKFFRPKRS